MCRGWRGACSGLLSWRSSVGFGSPRCILLRTRCSSRRGGRCCPLLLSRGSRRRRLGLSRLLWGSRALSRSIHLRSLWGGEKAAVSYGFSFLVWKARWGWNGGGGLLSYQQCRYLDMRDPSMCDRYRFLGRCCSYLSWNRDTGRWVGRYRLI